MSERSTCGAFVGARIHALAPDPAHLSAPGRAALAALRRGVGKPPGSVPEIWQHTLADAYADERRENAIHIALTHWALHQQSKALPMHRADRSFGQALRLLASRQDRGQPQSTPAYRRMMALAASRDLAAVTTHARGLIGQLRGEGFGFDYARWADDLHRIQLPGGAARVQRQWGQDFYRLSDDTVNKTLDEFDTPTTTTTEGDPR